MKIKWKDVTWHTTHSEEPLTVEQLIAVLQKYPPEAVVVVPDWRDRAIGPIPVRSTSTWLWFDKSHVVIGAGD